MNELFPELEQDDQLFGKRLTIRKQVIGNSKQQLIAKFGQSVRRIVRGGAEGLRFRFGPHMDQILGVVLRDDRVVRATYEVEKTTFADAFVMVSPGLPPMLWSRQVLEASDAPNAFVRVSGPLRLPDRGVWLTLTRKAFGRQPFEPHLHSSQEIRDLLITRHIVAMVNGPFPSLRDAHSFFGLEDEADLQPTQFTPQEGAIA